jgi:hypothetical protein
MCRCTQAQCNWSQLQSTLPDCAWEPVRRILAVSSCVIALNAPQLAQVVA